MQQGIISPAADYNALWGIQWIADKEKTKYLIQIKEQFLKLKMFKII
jgi:hypothetical protein